MDKGTGSSNGRVDMIDALRGTALIGLLLVHMVEHFELARYPEGRPDWLVLLDQGVHHVIFTLFGGKAYAIFALMFGISFTLILRSWSRRDTDNVVRLRFLWRLLLLGAMGYVHALLYIGDILAVMAVLGLPLVLLYRVADRWLVLIAAFLLIQVPSVGQIIAALISPEVPPAQPHHWGIYPQLYKIFMDGSFAHLIETNLVFGQMARVYFFLESGRGLQMAGLFILGLLIGRHQAYLPTPANRRLWGQVFRLSVAGIFIFYPLAWWAGTLPLQGMARYHLTMLAGSWANLAHTMVWASGFALIYARIADWAVTGRLGAFGRMSLTGYITQSMIWVPAFYGFGLGLYRHWGVAASVGVGILFLALQMVVADRWLQHFRYGPVEWFWRCATYQRFDLPLRRSTTS